MNTERKSSIPRNINPELGQLIRKRRNKLGLSVRDVAAQIGCSSAQLTRIENGTRRLANAKWIHDLADILSIPYDDLAALSDDKVVFSTGSALHKALPSINTPLEEKAVEDFAAMIKTRQITEIELSHVMVTVDALTAYYAKARQDAKMEALIGIPIENYSG